MLILFFPNPANEQALREFALQCQNSLSRTTDLSERSQLTLAKSRAMNLLKKLPLPTDPALGARRR